MVEAASAPAPVPAELSAAALPPLTRPDARVGLFGGQFDPVHNGHLAVARAAAAQLGLDHLFFIPAAHAPLRGGPPGASAADRIALLRVALAEENNPRFGVVDIEAREGGVHYTVDTVRRLRAAWPRARFVWVLGADQFAQLDRWREPRELAELVEFAVHARPGNEPAAPPALAGALRIHRLAGESHSERAADIRRLRREGGTWDLWLPRAVAAAIEERRLYR